jgi:sugar lactone lactonase YvrE
MTTGKLTTLASGFGYVEGIRWHDGAVWFSDLTHNKVRRVSLDGTATEVADVPGTPIGLGWRPDGTLLVVSSAGNQLFQVAADGAVSEYARLDVAVHASNDMWVDAAGRCYISHFGYDLFGGGTPATTGLILVQPDGSVELTGSDLMFPNGIAVTADGGTLVVAESFAFRLSAFDIGDDGRLSNKRLFAQFGNPETDLADGICIDAEDGVWVGCPVAGEYRRVVDGGEVTDVVRTDPAASFGPACALGGPDMRTLFLATTRTSLADLAEGWAGDGRIDMTEVAVPGRG